jgi:hypothetical protein
MAEPQDDSVLQRDGLVRNEEQDLVHRVNAVLLLLGLALADGYLVVDDVTQHLGEE